MGVAVEERGRCLRCPEVSEVKEDEESGGCLPTRLPASLRFLRLCVADIRELQPSVLMSEEVYVRMCARVLSSSLSPPPPLYISLPRSSLGSAVAPHCIFARVYTFINRLTYRAAYHHHIATRAGTGLD
jgi:hypothetical protein